MNDIWMNDGWMNIRKEGGVVHDVLMDGWMMDRLMRKGGMMVR